MARVLELIRARLRERPRSAAVVTADGRMSRAELWQRAEELAGRLAAGGLRPGEVVAVHTGRTAELPVAVLGTLLAGGAFCVLDPAYPEARLRQLRRDSGARFDLTAGLRLTPGADPAPAREQLAYVVFTSGSTGTPKAIGMPHRGLDNLVAWTLASTSARPLRTLQFAPLGFDVFVQEAFTAWCSGGPLYLPAEDERRDLVRLAGLLDEWGIERLFLPPVALLRLAEVALHTGRYPRALREVAAAGEALRVTPQLRRFFAALPECRLHNHYGPAETHVATAHTLTGPPAQWPDAPPIGRPIPGFTARVVDGELWLAGAGVSYGYLNDPELTGRRFLPVPWAEGPAYRTGDLAARRADGTYDYLGRADDQVKIRGHRVDPGEVEAVLGRYPGVRECAVAARQAAGEPQLVAYVVGDPSGVRAYLARSLPEYLVPRQVVAVPELPLTAHGKTDRARLPDPPAAPAEGEPPQDEWERTVASVWSAVLGRPDIGRDQHFLDLGGSSLSAALVIARLRERHRGPIALEDFLAAPTVRGLAPLLRDDRGTAGKEGR
ncbi:non-ribosomal peptide synthetase [Streptomyces sp. NPDC001606]